MNKVDAIISNIFKISFSIIRRTMILGLVKFVWLLEGTAVGYQRAIVQILAADLPRRPFVPM